jgi:hypothetical protein
LSDFLRLRRKKSLSGVSTGRFDVAGAGSK